jgi:hypothetical protein
MTIQDLSQTERKTPTALNFRLAPAPEIVNPFAMLSFDDLLRQHPYLPDSTAILGICEDGLPVLLDLTDSQPGSLLVGSTSMVGIRKLLHLALFSTLIRTVSTDLEVLVLSTDPDQWQPFWSMAGNHHLEILPVSDRLAGSAVLHFGRMLEQRMHGRGGREICLLLVDDLDAINRVDFDVQSNFEWLARDGPRHQIWAFSGLLAGQVERNDHFLGCFKTRLLGQVDDAMHATWIANARPPDTRDFHRTQQFSVRINRNWMNFWLPGR